MKGFVAFLAFIFVALLAALPARSAAPPAIRVHIDVSSQMMSVAVRGSHVAHWKVSTGAKGFRTPRGNFRPRVLRRMHYSSQYENSPMPHSIFFRGGYAIHGTDHVRSLGRPASHGCVRLAPRNAARLYALVKRYGMRATRISITN